MGFALSTVLHTSFDDAVTRTREALAGQGFGVLTEIDMQATLKAKLGEDMEQYLILGACTAPSTSTGRSVSCCPATSSCAPTRPTRRRCSSRRWTLRSLSTSPARSS